MILPPLVFPGYGRKMFLQRRYRFDRDRFRVVLQPEPRQERPRVRLHGANVLKLFTAVFYRFFVIS